MRNYPKGHQRSRLRVDPFILLQLLAEQQTTLSAVQQRTGFDPAELEPLRAAHKIHLDTLNRLAAGLNVPPNSLLITQTSPWGIHHCGNASRGRGSVIIHLSDWSPYDLGPLFR